MNTSSHISLEVLTDIAEDRVRPEVRETAMAHLSTCSACDDTLVRLRHLIRMMSSDSAADAPSDVLSSAINIFSPGTPPPLRRIVAVLIFDSRSAPPAFGMRSAHTASRQMLYSAQENDLDLRISVQNDECIVAGQVLRASCGGGLVEISGVSGSAEARLNELCEFTLPAVPLGNYVLRVKMVDVEIEVPELELTT
jgi:hypothetical protein